MGRSLAFPASWHLTLLREASPTSASPSLGPAHTQAPSNLKCFADHISSGLQALNKGPGSHHGPGYLGEGKEGEKKHRIVKGQSRLGPRDCTKGTSSGGEVCGVILGWLGVLDASSRGSKEP